MENSNEICCVYAYYEKDDKYKSNFELFLQKGILKHVDYYIVINGKCSVKIPIQPNIHIMHRENKGFDFGAHSHAVHKLNKEYNYYFFLNTSVNGPHIDGDWTQSFIQLFDNPDVQLVGTSICIWKVNLDKLKRPPPYPHVQSMFFCLKPQLFKELKEHGFFNETECNNMTTIQDIIMQKEIGLSYFALNKGYNINSILPEYKGIDYRTVKNDINPTSHNGDPYFKGAYFGKTIHPKDVIFFKNNRF